jgi:hypothetical protein
MTHPPADTLPPFDTEAEAGCLSCILQADEFSALDWLSQLSLDHFYDVRHQQIFRALSCLSQIDIITLVQWLKDKNELKDAGGFEYVSTLPDKSPSPTLWASFFEPVDHCRTRRLVLRDCGKLSLLARDSSIDPVALAETARAIADSHAQTQTKLATAWVVSDVADTMQKVLPEPVQIIEGLLCEHSKFVIGGSSKTYKSWLMGDIGLSLSAGATVLGRPCKPLRVLYVNLELKESTFERRLQTIIASKGLKLDYNRFHFLCLRGKLSGLSIQQIVDRLLTVAKRHQDEAILLDPLYKLNTEGEENSARDQTLFFNQLDRLTTEGNCSVIAADHFGKGNQADKDPLDAIRGSSAKGGDLDAALILRRHSQTDSFSVDIIHRELPPVAPFVVTWQFPLFHVNPDLDAQDMKKPGKKPLADPLKLLSFIARNDCRNPISISAWAKAAGIIRQTLQDYLPEMRRLGWIATDGEGVKARQFITNIGLHELNSNP